MLLYVEYSKLENKYIEAQKRYDDILDEKENYFLKTQPQSVAYDSERVDGGIVSNKNDTYLIKLEMKKIDERLLIAKEILKNRREQLNEKKKELKESDSIYDKMYFLRFIEGRSYQLISENTGYSIKQVGRILEKIKSFIKCP